MTTITPFTTATDERDELSTAVRRLLALRHDEGAVRNWMEFPDDYDRGLWSELATGMGVTAMLISEEHGGAGFSAADLAPVFEEAGRALYGGPLLSTVLATALLQASGDESACTRYLPAIADGRITATVALREEERAAPSVASSSAHDPIATRAELRDGGWFLTGTKTDVIDGCTAELVIVTARNDAGTGLYAVAPVEGGGVQRNPLATMDLTRKQARLAFVDAPAVPLGPASGASAALATALNLGAFVFAAECLGTARTALSQAVDYACSRRQFGRPIGSFQAVKHRLADMWFALETAAVVLDEAVQGIDRDGEPAPLDTEHALLACVEALSVCAQGNISVHGGIGFTWEHPAHLAYRRARSAQTLLGPLQRHRDRLSDLAGLRPSG
ncbi:acyl-CoA dehydrogenase family protein [Rhodococcus jostii]|uniref:Acyl-CoA dehydrogenase n=1 Tax=Rhodococcus jostii TaxID=132919 RepID=A0A1H5H657_RHOJO|nr:acyl-CoA dehydrogenase family protein [Rhodococcus jostii]SEE23467.1 acyl-CoA dehydrogenase [Rhodococcus jostii]